MTYHALVFGCGLWALLFGLLTTIACAPSGAFSPLVPPTSPSNNHEAGFAVAAGVDTKDIDEPEDVFSNGQFWYDVRVSETTETGFIIFAGQTSLVGFGGRVRTTFARSSRFALAFEGQLGIFWIAAALPMSLRLTQGIHLYTAPSAGARNASPVLLPLGIAFHTTDDYLFMIEGSLGMDPHVFEDRWVYTPSLGGALAWKF